jgi:hypothetical protein
MAEHRTLTGDSLHEPKGADTANSGEVYVADGAGSGSWDGSLVKSKQVVVKSAADLAGTLSSDVEYLIDGIIDMGSQSIEVPLGGLNLSGYNFDVSKLISSEPGYTMFVSPGGGSGNFLGKDYSIEVTGIGSRAYFLSAATGLEAFEFARINYNDCTSLGTIDGYRQGLESGTGRFGGTPNLILAGTWLGGYFIETSIVRGLTDGAYSLFEAGTGFVMNSRFRTNQNIDLPASASFLDFAPANFANPSLLQIQGAIVTRAGVVDANDPNITPNITKNDLECDWTNNNGMPNTFEGGSIGVASEAATVIASTSTFVDIAAASWSALDLQHFDNPSAGQLRHLGNSPREFKVIADFTLVSGANNELKLRVRKWSDAGSVFETVLVQTRQVNNLTGGRDVAFFNININVELDQNDYIVLQVSNETAVTNVTAELDSYYIIEGR